jgi:tetratricopeptide (TPR) repeat protein
LARHRFSLLLVAAALIVIAIGPALASRLASNVGLVTLNRSLAQHDTLWEEGSSDPNLAQAERWLRLATELDAANQGAWRGLGFALAAQGREDEVVSAWRTARGIGEELVQRGEAMRKVRRTAEALVWYERAVRVEPGLASTVLYHRYTTLIAAGRIDTAIDNLSQAVALDRGWLTAAIRFRAWHDWGIWLHAQKQNIEAERALLWAIELYPKGTDLQPVLSETYRFLGLAQWAQGRLDDAAQNLELAVELDEQNVWAHIHYGKVLYLHDPGRASETEQEFAVALQLDPTSASVWRNLVEFWFWVKEVERLDTLCRQAPREVASALVELCPSS